jgi:hypothetical protein
VFPRKRKQVRDNFQATYLLIYWSEKEKCANCAASVLWLPSYWIESTVQYHLREFVSGGAFLIVVYSFSHEKETFPNGSLQSVNRLYYHNNKLVSRYIICSITQSTVTEIKINLNPFKTLKLQCKFTIYLLKKYLVTTAIDNKIFEFNKERKH